MALNSGGYGEPTRPLKTRGHYLKFFPTRSKPPTPTGGKHAPSLPPLGAQGPENTTPRFWPNNNGASKLKSHLINCSHPATFNMNIPLRKRNANVMLTKNGVNCKIQITHHDIFFIDIMNDTQQFKT
jgi:hypothetical protein